MNQEELGAALEIKKKIDRLQASLDTLRETGGVGGISAGETVQGGISGTDAGQLAVEMEEEIARLTKSWEVECTVIQRGLDKIEMPDIHRRLLELRYVRCLSWAMVGKAMGYTDRHVMRLKSDAEKMSHDVTRCH